MKVVPLRLKPGDDLKASLIACVNEHRIQAGIVLTAVGSLSQAVMRFAGNHEGDRLDGPLELVSLVGTLSLDGVHLHLVIANNRGEVRGGHVMPGCQVYTTAEIVVGVLDCYHFKRPVDPQTGFRELEISSLG